MIRPPAVAGRFYPSDPREISEQIADYTQNDYTQNDSTQSAREKVRAVGCIVPHAGYMYSGHVAGAVYRALELPRRFLLLGPRHFPRGQSLAILSEGEWRTPLGDAKIDTAMAAELKYAFPKLREDAVAHESEHSLEVQIPFLQQLVGEFTFVPVVLGSDRYTVLEELGNAIAELIAKQADPVLIVASSDMNHYENDAITRQKDYRALQQIVALDPLGLYDVVRRENISMCGYAPTVSMIAAAKALGATRAELVKYATSADVTGEKEQVVGYAGMIIR